MADDAILLMYTGWNYEAVSKTNLLKTKFAERLATPERQDLITFDSVSHG